MTTDLAQAPHRTGTSGAGRWRSWLRDHFTPMAGVPRWAHWAAILAALTPLPSSIWRIALGLGADAGFRGDLAELYNGPSWKLTPYVIVLSALSEAFAFLAIGLVRPWGEVAPRWIPFIGGKPVRPLAAIVPACLGAMLVTAITVAGLIGWNGAQNMGDPDAPHGAAATVMTACYAPLLLWGPLLSIVVIAYAMRRYSGVSR